MWRQLLHYNFSSLPFMKSANSSLPNIIKRSLRQVDQGPWDGTQPHQNQLALANPAATSGSRVLLKFGSTSIPILQRNLSRIVDSGVLGKYTLQKTCCRGPP